MVINKNIMGFRLHYFLRDQIYPSHILRIFRPMSGSGIGLVIWRHEFSISRSFATKAQALPW